MAVRPDNLNLNLNLNLAAGSAGAAGNFGRLRFGTEEFPKLADLTPPGAGADDLAAVPDFPHRAEWDAESRAWEYVIEFVQPNGQSFTGWLDKVRIDLDANAATHCPAGPKARLNAGLLNEQLAQMMDRSLDRTDRLQEIVDQADAEGALNYWTGMLALQPSARPKTHLLIRVGRAIGEMTVMRLKAHYMCPRPSRINPRIVPAIDPPDTPAFPAGHALGAHLISELLILAVDQTNAPIPNKHLKRGTFARALRELADRVADNRVVAGLHFPIDNAAGKVAAGRTIARMLGKAPSGAPRFPQIVGLIAAARTENTQP